MTKEIERLLNEIKREFSDNDIVKILMSSSQTISNSLAQQKSNIMYSLKNKSWDKIQKEFEETFEKENKNLKNELIKALDTASTNIKNYLDQCYNNLDQKFERKNLSYKNYISYCLRGNNDINKTIDQMINDIISGSRSSTEKDKCEGFFSWLGGKMFDDNYLNKIIDYIIQHFTKRIKNFSDTIKQRDEHFKKDIIDEIISAKERVVNELKETKMIEDIEIRIALSNYKEEKKKWEMEKRKLEETKKQWEQLCRKYRILKKEILELIKGF